MSTQPQSTCDRRPWAALRALTGALVTALALAACAGAPAPDNADGPAETAAPSSSAAATPGPTTAPASTSSITSADEIPAVQGDGVNERLLPDESLLGRTGWRLTGESADLTEPYYRHPCSPASAIEEWSDPISNVGRVWDVSGFNVPSLPAPPGEIAVDLYGYGSPEDADAAFSAYAATLESCGETGPDGRSDQVIGDVDLDPTGRYPLDAGFVVRSGSETSHTDIIVARQGQILIVAAYRPALDGQLGDVDTTALSEAVLGPVKEIIGESY